MLYKVFADYRDKNPKHPTYYVYAETAIQAKKRFEKAFTWLKVYDVFPCGKTEMEIVLSNPCKHIIL